MKRFLKGFIKYVKRLDKFLLLLCVIASLFGVYLLRTIYENGINPSAVSSRTWRTQLTACIGGSVCALIISAINYKLLSKFWFVYAAVALVLSALLFTPLGMSTPGSSEVNWLNLGFMQIQPSEFLMVAFIMSFSAHLCKIGDKMNQLAHFLLLCLHVMIPVGLITLQDNTGSSVIILFVFLTMLFMAGLSWRYVIAGTLAAPVLGYVFWNFYAKDYQKLRILVIFDKEKQASEVLGAFHQQMQGLIAMSSGGLTGQGLSGGEYVSLFAIHNDFMFAYIGMTLGLIGCVLTLLLLLVICVRVLMVMGAARDLQGRLICAGVFALIFSHCVLNVGMVTVVLPVIGVPLPFVSAGGSSTLALFIAAGLVSSVWAHKEKEYHMFYTEKD
ncbi:MAG: FtsW/RodA/SpoVE family cell cycle protein [Oscillospiraceae bacterium]|jgi:rod shape determining protein RodA|nr:FtsW/RodA/SpoVE family cell cycle protein [Oscillospiraceae bacterium]